MQYAISFDFWNTLYANGAEDQRQKLRIQYFHKVLSNYKKIGMPLIEQAFQASTHMFIDEWMNKQRTPDAVERVQYMCKLIGLRIDSDDVNKTAEYFGDVINLVPPLNIPSVKQLIPKLAIKFPLAIISDTGYIRGESIREFLEKERLLSFFKFQFFSDEHKHSKPHASVFHLTCQNLKVDSRKLIHIGDLEQTDVKGIKNFGGISIKYTGTTDSHSNDSQADYIIHDYNELPMIINKITTN